jgi:hypothetical protein
VPPAPDISGYSGQAAAGIRNTPVFPPPRQNSTLPELAQLQGFLSMEPLLGELVKQLLP